MVLIDIIVPLKYIYINSKYNLKFEVVAHFLSLLSLVYLIIDSFNPFCLALSLENFVCELN